MPSVSCFFLTIDGGASLSEPYCRSHHSEVNNNMQIDLHALKVEASQASTVKNTHILHSHAKFAIPCKHLF